MAKQYYCHTCKNHFENTTPSRHERTAGHKAAVVVAEQAYEEYRKKNALRTLGHKAAHIRGVTGYTVVMNHANIDASYQYAEDVAEGKIVIDPTELEREAEAKWAELAPQCHDDCKNWFMQYGRTLYEKDKGYCPICGHPVLCGGEKRKHNYRSLSREEERARGLTTGRCYSNYICTQCGDLYAVDSSD